MTAPRTFALLPALPPTFKLALLGISLAVLVYAVFFWTPTTAPITADPPTVAIEVATPKLNHELLATAQDGTREQRLELEPEPLRHLLAVAVDVVPTVAEALGMPEQMVPLAELRQAPAQWRNRWLWYEGEILDLTGPREGHPIQGRSIYEVTLALANGDRALAAFTEPPPAELQRGAWARIEGFLLKLRDTTYPLAVEQAPFLVGRSLQRDYPDWGPVLSLDRSILPEAASNDFWPGSQAWKELANDQCEALWHLAAFARDTAPGQSLADWRKFGTLNVTDTYPLLQHNQLAPGTRLRVLGTLVRRTTLAAPSNPAGIKHWTMVWMQVRDFAGHLIPVWLPKRAEELPLRTDLELRGYFYRWLVYDAQDGKRYHVPLFVAADLDRFDLGTARMTTQLSITMASAFLLLALFVVIVKRRNDRSAMQHAQELTAMRKRLRQAQTEKPTAAAENT